MFTKNDIFESLRAMGAPRGGVVLVHSSLRSVGEVLGGGAGLLDALIEYFTAEGGLLCIPTHTWNNLGRDRITLDHMNPESCLGALATLAAHDERAVRTDNPSHSMAIFGDRERALEFALGEDKIKTPTAPDSCYGKLFCDGGYVLLIGVSHSKNTLLHCAEETVGLPHRMVDQVTRVTTRHKDGQIFERGLCLFDTDYCDDISLRFPKYETAFRYHRCITDGFIGNAPSQLCIASRMLDTIALIFKRSGGRDPLFNEEMIPPSLYV